MFTKMMTVVVLLFSFHAQASPQIEQWETNGAKVLYVYAPEIPMVDISLVFNAGAARDGDKNGVARLTNLMLDEGAQALDMDEIAEAFANVGARYSVSTARDMAVVGLRSLTDSSKLTPALALFTAVLTEPTFPKASFNRLKQQVLTSLYAEKQSPNAVAARTFYKALYGDHPYAKMSVGEQQTVENLSVADLKKFHQTYYVAENAVMAIVGDINKQKAQEIAKQLLGSMTRGKKAATLPPVKQVEKSQVIKLSHPSTQTTLMMGQVGIARQDPDYFPLYVGNHILGGSGLVSQLSQEVREKRGLSYSVYSAFTPMQMKGPYQFGLQTRNDQAQQALEVVTETLKNFQQNGPTEAALIAAKKNITGGFALRLDSNREIVGYLAMLAFYDLPLDYLDTFNDKINQVTVSAIKDAFNRRVQPEKMITVMVGGEN